MATSGQGKQNSDVLRYSDDSFSESDLSASEAGSSFTSDSQSETSSVEGNAFRTREKWEGAVTTTGELFYVRAIQQHVVHDDDVTDAATALHKRGGRVPGKLQEFIKGGRFKRGKRRKRQSESEECKNSENVVRLVAGTKKEVWIQVDPTRPRNLGRRASTAETVFGFVVGESQKAVVDFEEANEEATDIAQAVIIKGLVPGGAALTCGQVRVGDWLRRVDETNVMFANLERTLLSVVRPRKVKLAFHSLYKAPVNPHLGLYQEDEEKPIDIPLLVKLLKGDISSWDQLTSTLVTIQHVVMYLDLAVVGGDSDRQPAEATDKADVVYHFPKGNCKLVAARGIFMTLCQLVDDVTGSPALRTALMVDDNLVHASYTKDGNCLFVVATPFTSAPWGQLLQLTTDFIRVLRFQYGSLLKAFSDDTHHPQLDQLFALTFQKYFTEDWQLNADITNFDQKNFSSIPDIFSSVPVIPVPIETKVIINDILSEFSSADWSELSEDHYDMRRLYTILGSCVFYKGNLLANHLMTNHFYEVSLFARACGILELSKSPCLAETVIWKEVFPSGFNSQTTIPYRWFILIVGFNQSLIAVLLEAGGCAFQSEGKTGPDAFYVDQARNTLLHLETTDALSIAEAWLQGNSWPPLASTKVTEQSPTQSKKMQLKPNKADKATSLNTSQNIRLRKSASSEFYPQGLLAPISGEGDSDTTSLTLTTSDDGRRDSWNAYGSDVDSRDGSEGAIYRVSQTSRWLPTLSDFANKTGNPKNRDLPSSILASGQVNGLFHYVSLDTCEGILLCPPEQQLQSCTLTEIIDNFRTCVLAVRQLLHSTADNMRDSLEEKCIFVTENNFKSVREQGVLFRCNSTSSVDATKVQKSLNYWVVGRIFKGACIKEVYVCYEDLTPQNLVEMAFKLSIGVLG